MEMPVISLFTVSRMVEKGCLSYLSSVCDTSVSTSHLMCPMFREFIFVFPTILPSLPPNNDIHFGIDVESCTQLFSTQPYWMAPGKLQ